MLRINYEIKWADGNQNSLEIKQIISANLDLRRKWSKVKFIMCFNNSNFISLKEDYKWKHYLGRENVTYLSVSQSPYNAP